MLSLLLCYLWSLAQRTVTSVFRWVMWVSSGAMSQLLFLVEQGVDGMVTSDEEVRY